jgi:hypothetical protein
MSDHWNKHVNTAVRILGYHDRAFILHKLNGTKEGGRPSHLSISWRGWEIGFDTRSFPTTTWVFTAPTMKRLTAAIKCYVDTGQRTEPRCKHPS